MAIKDETSGDAATLSQTMRLVFSTVPALVGWLATFFSFDVVGILLIGAVVMLLAYDIWAEAKRSTPSWYLRLRVQLTTGVVAALALAWSSGP